MVRRYDTLSEGGAFESEYLEVFGVRDSRVTHLELYELDDHERAVARVQALSPDATRVLRDDRPEHGRAHPGN